ncbi:TPA: GTP pyrophosphokinase [Citrobacter werkmanii]
MEQIIAEYDDHHRTFISFANSLKSLIERFLLNEDIEVHTIASRVKDRKSLEKKIISKGSYNKISDITDIVGIRIITHYSDDVDKIAKVIEKEFSIDRDNSIDKRATLDPDRFGYLSLHYIVGLKKDRLNLAEYTNFKEMKAEIQIRSILQHTWAEIEHDTGYKSSTGIPDPIRRKFSRLAGLLEIADDEFVEIKKSLERHKNKIARELKKGANNIPLDQVSLVEYINSCDIIKTIAEKIKSKTGHEVSQKAGESYLPTILSYLKHIQINNIKELDDILKENEEGIYKRLNHIISGMEKSDAQIPRQLIISYLTQVLAIKDGDYKKIDEYISILNKNRVKHSENYREKLYENYVNYFIN